MEKQGFCGRMSYYRAPIATYEDQDGRLVYASLRPLRSVTIKETYDMIVHDEALAEAHAKTLLDDEEFRVAKSRCLPFIQPFGEFERRVSTGLRQLSGYFPIDIDGFDLGEEVEDLKRELWDDVFLRERIKLMFTSPSGRGLKILFDYAGMMEERKDDEITLADINLMQTFVGEWIENLFQLSGHVDVTGKDVARACFLCHDENALMRE